VLGAVEVRTPRAPGVPGGPAALRLLPHDRFAAIAESGRAPPGNRIDARPQEHASLVLAADRYARGSVELTLAADDVPDAWAATLADTYVPTRLLAWRPSSEDGLVAWLDELGLSEAPPIWAERGTRDGEPTVYACRNFTCSPPTDDLDEALRWAHEHA
jgi:uncharacterized protein YyaL (SSP411 family)